MALANLHSNMDRLKPCAGAKRRGIVADLHSNMDRLKRGRCGCEQRLVRIYIPIWID